MQRAGETVFMMDGMRRSCARAGDRVGSIKSRIRSAESRATEGVRVAGGRTRRSTWQISW